MVNDLIIRELADNLEREGFVNESLANDTAFRRAVEEALTKADAVPPKESQLQYHFNVGSGSLDIWLDHSGNSFLAVSGYDKILLNEDQINILVRTVRGLRPHQGG